MANYRTSISLLSICFQKQNQEISRILITQAHLIDGDDIPEAFAAFMTSATICNLYTARPGKPFVEQAVAQLEDTRFPLEFRDYIYSKTKDMKLKLSELYSYVAAEGFRPFEVAHEPK